MIISEDFRIIIYFFLFISLFLILSNFFLTLLYIIQNYLPNNIREDILNNTKNFDNDEILTMYFLSKFGLFALLNTSIVLSCNIFRRFLTLYDNNSVKKKIFKN